MDLWDDELRVCQKCGRTTRMGDEGRVPCPNCEAPVWFFNFRKIADPPELPRRRTQGIWGTPASVGILASAGIFGLVALVAIYQHLVVAAVSALAAISFAVFAFVRHAEAVRIEDGLRHAERLTAYAETMRDRVRELTARYNHLLRTGDRRIEEYYDTMYRRAAEEREGAERLRQEAARDRAAVGSVEQRIYATAARLIDDHRKWASTKLRADTENYQRRKLELEKAFNFVESVGYAIPPRMREEALAKLKADYQRVVREQAMKDEQRRLKQQMRDEERVQRERDAAVLEAERWEWELQARLDAALKEQRSAHGAVVEELRRQLAEAHASAERAKSMAQMTKAGHVYILSNIGSFGEGVYKVGMTRRLDPQERVEELGDASVPFPFDVHAMISCTDAPSLENALHHHLTQYRVNRVNLRKEFFRVELDTILDAVRENHGEVDYVAEPEALEYRDSLETSPENVVELEEELAEAGVVFDEVDE